MPDPGTHYSASGRPVSVLSRYLHLSAVAGGAAAAVGGPGGGSWFSRGTVPVTGRYPVRIVNTMAAPEGEKTSHKGIELRLHHIQTENCGPLSVYVQVAMVFRGKYYSPDGVFVRVKVDTDRSHGHDKAVIWHDHMTP